MKKERWRVGTSGWSYAWWRGLFYPEDLPGREWLGFYARQFSTVEINMTYYRLPAPRMLEDWAKKTPPGFTFVLKAPKIITHQKRLRDAESDILYFYDLARGLGKKLGGILFQLPPSLRRDDGLLAAFASVLSSEVTNVVEFRHPSWYAEEVAELLRARGVVFCAVSSLKVPSEIIRTSDTLYARFHGLRDGPAYKYSEAELGAWAERILGSGAKNGYIFFNNDDRANAPENARTMAELLDAP
jgi:uncharacterized protein YecE (DUF72 family)